MTEACVTESLRGVGLDKSSVAYPTESKCAGSECSCVCFLWKFCVIQEMGLQWHCAVRSVVYHKEQYHIGVR